MRLVPLGLMCVVHVQAFVGGFRVSTLGAKPRLALGWQRAVVERVRVMHFLLSAPTHRHGCLLLSLSREPPVTPAPHLRQIVAVLFSFRVELRSAFSLFDMDNSGMVGGWWLSHVGTLCNDVNLCGRGACMSWSSVGLGPGDAGLAASTELWQRRRVHIMSSVSTPVCRVAADQHERVSSRHGSPERPPHHLQD